MLTSLKSILSRGPSLSGEPGVRRKLLYRSRDAVRRRGIEALRGVGRPWAGERLAAAMARPHMAPPSVARRVRASLLPQPAKRAVVAAQQLSH